MKLSRNEKGLEKSKIHQKSKISECAQKSKAFPTFQKKEVLLVITILLSITTYATCDVTDTINKTTPKNYTISGKDYSITLSSLSNSSGDWLAKFKVNGISTSELEENQKHTFDDLSDINILSVPSSSTVQICFNAGLTGYGKGTCSSTKECDDNNPCTIDECDGDPLRCHHKLILWCRNDDGCCPSRCNNENDNDCEIAINKTTATETRCVNNSDCDDNNSITKDICDNTTRRCSYTTITECLSEDNFCPENCTFTSDTDCDECSTNEDCNDNNACTSDTCSGSPKRCFNNATLGCDFNEQCIPTGTRTEDQFCHTDNTMQKLRSKKEYCDHDYECLSNLCKKNICKNPSFIKKITNWFKGLFGR